MTRGNRASRERGSTRVDEPPERNDSEDASSARAIENEKYAKRSKTSQKRWSSSEDSSRPYSRDIKTVCTIYKSKIIVAKYNRRNKFM